MINAKRPQTSYGGISARQRNRRKSAKAQNENNEVNFPEPNKPFGIGMQNNLLDMNNKIN